MAADVLPQVEQARGFPLGMAQSGERVDADPANMLRDVFLANRGRIDAVQVANMIGRHSFTYGYAIREAWDELVAEGYVERVGTEYVWPMQVATMGAVEVEPAHHDTCDGCGNVGERTGDYTVMCRTPDCAVIAFYRRAQGVPRLFALPAHPQA